MGKPKQESSITEPSYTQKESLTVVPEINNIQLIHTFWSSSLFNEVYIQNDIQNHFSEIWEEDEIGPFYDFYNGLLNLVSDISDEDCSAWSETETINNFIKPVMAILGWQPDPNKTPIIEEVSFTIEEHGEKRTYRPDLLYVEDQNHKKYISGEKNQKNRLIEARHSVIMLVEAKYWDRLEEYRQGKLEMQTKINKKFNDNSKSLSPEDQIIKYMKVLKLDKQPYGILTDGKTWRLFHREESNHKCFEFDLGNLIQYIDGYTLDSSKVDIFVRAAKYFYFFFSKQTLCPVNKEGDHEEPILNEILEYSKKYVNKAEEDLKDSFIKAMTYACNGYKRVAKEEIGYDLIRSVSESLLLNLLFIKNCEVRNVLPFRCLDYRKDYSLTDIIERLDNLYYDPLKDDAINLKRLKITFGEIFDFSYNGTELYDRIIKLTKIIHSGIRGKSFGFQIEGFRESVFVENEWAYVNKFKLSNKEVVDILFQIGFTKSEESIRSRKYQQIPYNAFTPRQLGSVYESFLEYSLAMANESMVYLTKKNKNGCWEKITASIQKKLKGSELIIKAGQLFFTHDRSNKKSSGSYYTPDYIVQYIVKETINPLCKDPISGKIKSSSEILQLKVCDPAMGSGHFLVATLHLLTSKYLEALGEEVSREKLPTKAQAKRTVLDKCIFGVDINPSAVKLTKMSLWLESAHAGKKLKRLNDKIIHKNLLENKNSWKEYLDIKFSAFVQNPPYIGEKGNKDIFEPVKKSWLSKHYQGKMDYFYFFIHAGLELLQEDGRMGLITTNYFITALGAKKLRTYLKKNSKALKFIQLNGNKIFRSASGQHNMISIITKGFGEPNILVIDIPNNKDFDSNKFYENPDKFEELVSDSRKFSGEFEHEKENYIRLPSSVGSESDGSNEFSYILEKVTRESEYCLGKRFNVNQGIVSGADKVSDAHLKKYDGLEAKKGDGIFVLSKEEVMKKRIPKDYLRPFFKNSDIFQFMVNEKTDKYILYLDRKVSTVEPPLMEHFLKFKEILEQRREVRNGRINWFNLQWPRENEIFRVEKIVVPQRSKINTFGYNTKPWYASADVYFITQKKEPIKATIHLKYILGLLNSKIYYLWFYCKGKKKGDMLELLQTPLSEARIPVTNQEKQKRIIEIIDILIENSSDKEAFQELNKEIYAIFNLNTKDIQIIEEFYQNRVGGP